MTILERQMGLILIIDFVGQLLMGLVPDRHAL